jgi:predicted RNA-binding Zn-ribbon protein involved in translation (DUF1610 family)
MDKCPGQDKRNLKVEVIICPSCKNRLEFFSDEIKLVCPKCKELVCRKKLPSCVDWCKYARECVGEDRWRQLKGKEKRQKKD